MRTVCAWLCIMLGGLLLVPPFVVAAWTSRQYAVGFDERFRLGLIVISLLGPISVVAGTMRVIRRRRRPPD